MKRTPKQIGTAAETKACRWLTEQGWNPHRQALSGARDTGDLVICGEPLVIAEVKAGEQADSAGPVLIAAWLDETGREQLNANAVLGALIVARKFRPVAHWDVYLFAAGWLRLLTDDDTYGGWDALSLPLRSSLADFSELLGAWIDGGAS